MISVTRFLFKILLLAFLLPCVWTPGVATGQEEVELVVQSGHTGLIESVAFSPDGRFIISGSTDRTVRFWDINTGREIRTFTGHLGLVTTVAFSPDGRYVISGAQDKVLRLWEVATGRQIRAFVGHINEAKSVVFSHDGRYIVSCGTGGYSKDAPRDKAVRLWETESGRLIRTFVTQAEGLVSVAFSPHGKYILSGTYNGTIELWDMLTGAQIRTFKGHCGPVMPTFTPDRNSILSAGLADKTLKLWDIARGNEIRTFRGHRSFITSVAISPDGRYALSGSQRIRGEAGQANLDDNLKLWDLASGREIRTFKNNLNGVTSVAFAPNGRYIVSTNGPSETGIEDGYIRLWSISTGAEVKTLKGYVEKVEAVAYTPDGKHAVSANGITLRIWDLTMGSAGGRLTGHKSAVTAVAVSPDGRFALSGSGRKGERTSSIKLWDLVTRKEVRTFEGNAGNVTSVSFSPDGRLALSSAWDGCVRLWEVSTGRQIKVFPGESNSVVQAAAFSPDGRWVLSSGFPTIKLWDLTTGSHIRTFSGHTSGVTAVAFSPDGKYVLSASADRTVRLWDISSGKEIRRFGGHLGHVYSVAMSPDQKKILSGSQDKTIRLWDVSSGRTLATFAGHTGLVGSAVFSPGGENVLSGSEDGTVRLWGTPTGYEIARMVGFADGGWAVIDGQGRFDASNAGDVDGLHWVANNEPIALHQLKERYYEPGLLAKILGFNKEPVCDVETFKSVSLYPTIELEKPTAKNPTLRIKLNNRGGGIGRVFVSINGKEIASDARGEKVAPDAKSAELSIDIGGHPYLKQGEKNRIEVRGYNAEGYLSSRGVVVDYDVPGIAPSEKPTLWAIVSGISDYKGTTIDLGYAAKDAVDVANAVRLGASRLLSADRVQISLLTTESISGAAEPTKKMIIEAFTKARKAKSTDILLVYLAGHGVTYGGAEGDYYYLTRDAMTADLSDPAVREAVALSSNELLELIWAIPATKQVLVLDTCGAGRAVEALSAKREISSSQIRALERMKDRFGLFILGGATADKVSYEASRFGQGLLTYSLLVGMQKGPALREERFIDVSTLFNYAEESVPALAKDIGGIQQPIKAVPKGGASFDFGELTREDREQIKVASPKPFVLRSVFQDAELFRDHLTLAQRVNDRWRAVSSRGREAPVIFVDVDEAPEAYSLVGRYQCRDEDVTADVRVFRGAKEVGRYRERGKKGEADKFADKIVARAQETIRQQPR